MITVSTASPLEAQVAAGVLEAHLPRAVGYEVYLRGVLFKDRLPSQDLLTAGSWRLPDAEVRGASPSADR